jgi:opacity protein-like surface antigen
MKSWLAAVLVGAVTLGVASTASAELGGQVFFRGGYARLTEGSRSREILTDTRGNLGAAGRRNDDKAGLSLGFGLDIPLFKDPWLKNTVLGEVLIDYAQFSRNRVRQALSTLTPLSEDNTTRLSVTQLVIVAAPKYRAEFGRIRPWIIPVGMLFAVNSPPSDDVTVLQPGLHFGAGVEYRLMGPISVGVDGRYNLEFNSVSNVKSGDFFTVGGYLGFNF